MRFGPVPPKLLPYQDSAKILLHAERQQRASWANRNWAERAKKCVDMFEGRQWTAEQLAARKGRPSFQFNIIAPLVRLILGYHRGNKTDITFQPGQDLRASEQLAEALTRIEKVIAEGCDMPFVDTEVFMDGLIASRGFFDTRLDFEHNDLGEIKTAAQDPFCTFPDPDADTYDLDASAAFINTAKMISIDEIEAQYGKTVAGLVRPFVNGQTPLAPLSSQVLNEEITPVRMFGERNEGDTAYWDQLYSMLGDFVDTRRKSIRMLETQYKVFEPKNVIIDLETGDKKVLPDEWNAERIAKVLLYCEQQNNPCVVQNRIVERIHWTIMAGDVILYDAPSMYDKYTLTGYFPYFRRGYTRGMVDDLVDPQLNKNKHRNAQIELVSKTANGGWKYHESSLTPVQKARLLKHGSEPGFNLEWKGTQEPKISEPSSPGTKFERLEKQDDEDIHQISGVNESALGQLDRVQSGRAIEARQRQAVLSVQMYMDNFKRAKQLVGQQHLSIVQNHYTEARMYRIMGPNGKFSQVLINQQQQDPTSGVKMILNDVTVGKYTVVIDDAPLNATFLNAQFEEMMQLLEKMGPAIGPKLPMFADLIMDMSTLPRKDEWIERFKQLMAPQQTGPDPKTMSEVNRNNAQAESARASAFKNINSVTLDQAGFAADLAHDQAEAHGRQVEQMGGAPAPQPAPAAQG